jgi:hypothetical protein
MTATPRAWKLGRTALLLGAAFLLGGGSAEVAVRTSQAIEKAKAEREIGPAGQLVALDVRDADGDVVARPRLIAPEGKAAQLVLHDPERPAEVRLSFRVEAARDPSGFIALKYALFIPDRALSARGILNLTPGVEQAIELGDGATASLLAVPVPSAAFDAFLEGEAARRAPGKTS